ncbi:hypothetical protein [Pseudomonas fragi]|uniref:hypothetical protein n=1 Tax=Pseudomonas fragi TaxID=296 RepID=UPI001FD27FD6|nr:hypothetical protein [Pseudomonas fragi]
MPNPRDEFTRRTKSDLALRSSYLCCLCKCSTVGPSDEAPNAVAMIGVAAHIAAAAAGPGARRYDPKMANSERSHIDNGIWLCATCSILIDRDDKRFTVEYLHNLKIEHEASRRIHGNGGTDSEDIIAIGPDLIALGSVIKSEPAGPRVRISHFLQGNIRELWSLARDFKKWPIERRYVLLNELGSGGLLAEAPSIERTNQGYEVQLSLQDDIPRRDASKLKSHCVDTLKIIEGLSASIQNFESILGMARGTWFTDLNLGSDISDLYWRYFGSPWFKDLVMMEIIRLSSVPSISRISSELTTPMACVNRVNRIEVPSFNLANHRIAINVDFELEGIGNWQGALSVFISNPEELNEGRAIATKARKQIEPTQHRNVVAVEAEVSHEKIRNIFMGKT